MSTAGTSGTSGTSGTDATSERPALRIVAGSPTPEELAIVVAVVNARSGARAAQPPKFSLWARKSRMTRPSLRPGYGAWRASYMPR